MPEQTITRTQIIVVSEVGQNTYGDLTFSDKEGKEYKVSAKRKSYFEKVILPGVAVQLNYAVFMKKEYIYSAVPVKDKLPPTKTESPLVEAAKKMGAEEAEKPTLIIHDTKTRSMAIAYAKDLAVAGKIELKDMSVYADKFLQYMNK